MFAEAVTIAELKNPQFLSGLVGPLNSVECSPLHTVGFSGTTHERVRITLATGEVLSLVLKDIRSEQDLSVWRTGNVNGREARMFGERNLDPVWNIFQSPFLAYAYEDARSGLLMQDLSGFLFPDIREPLLSNDEEILLKAFAKLHARFWEDPVISGMPWLMKESAYFNFLSPASLKEEKLLGRKNPVFDAAAPGWDHVRELVSEELWDFINRPAEELLSITEGLPKTLLHGDSKVANFAIGGEGRVYAFDWSMIAYAPSACEIGWYVTVNATRLSRPKEEIFFFYRNELEKNLGTRFSSSEWSRMEATAILTGAITLLWSKALNFHKGLSGSKEEWSWWVENIQTIKSEYFS